MGTVLSYRTEGSEDKMMSCCGLQPHLVSIQVL